MNGSVRSKVLEITSHERCGNAADLGSTAGDSRSVSSRGSVTGASVLGSGTASGADDSALIDGSGS